MTSQVSSERIQFFLRDGVRKIVFNRPEKRNAISQEMYRRLTEVLNEDAKNDEIVITIITGKGSYYSSGNDMTNVVDGGTGFAAPRNLVQAFIDYPKLIIAVVNGPAIGIAATTAALCDIVYASDKAYFDTPFLRMGICAEGTSSYMYPRILGRSKASEALFLSKKISAHEAYTFGLVSDIIPSEKIEDFIEGLYKYGSLPVSAVKLNKQLVMHQLKKILSETNDREFEALKGCFLYKNPDQIPAFFKKSKCKL